MTLIEVTEPCDYRPKALANRRGYLVTSISCNRTWPTFCVLL